MEEGGDLLLFFGRWHPLLVHLPIGILFVSFVMVLFSRRPAYSGLGAAVPFTLLIGASSAILASLSGYLLSRNGGYETHTLGFHQWFGISVAAVSLLVWRLYYPPSDQRTYFRLLVRGRFLILSVLMLLVGITGHYGGTLTHGKGYLSDAMPPGLSGLFGVQREKDEPLRIENVQEAWVYEELVQPILSKRCQSCHGATKKEGGLAMHQRESLLKGGDGGKVIVPERIDESELYTRLILPVGDEKRMPPKGRTPITSDEIALIAWWIEQGTLSDTKIKDIEQSAEIVAVLARMEAGKPDPILPEAPPLSSATVQKLTEKGIQVIPVSHGSNYVMISAITYREFNDQDAEALVDLKDNIVQLKLGQTAITDRALSHIARLSVLRQLHLERTAITDDGLAALKACQQLEYLNLSGTIVGDAGVQQLKTLSALNRLYLFETEVTGNAVVDFQQSQPMVLIDTGRYKLPPSMGSRFLSEPPG